MQITYYATGGGVCTCCGYRKRPPTMPQTIIITTTMSRLSRTEGTLWVEYGVIFVNSRATIDKGTVSEREKRKRKNEYKGELLPKGNKYVRVCEQHINK